MNKFRIDDEEDPFISIPQSKIEELQKMIKNLENELHIEKCKSAYYRGYNDALLNKEYEK